MRAGDKRGAERRADGSCLSPVGLPSQGRLADQTIRPRRSTPRRRASRSPWTRWLRMTASVGREVDANLLRGAALERVTNLSSWFDRRGVSDFQPGRGIPCNHSSGGRPWRRPSSRCVPTPVTQAMRPRWRWRGNACAGSRASPTGGAPAPTTPRAHRHWRRGAGRLLTAFDEAVEDLLQGRLVDPPPGVVEG